MSAEVLSHNEHAEGVRAFRKGDVCSLATTFDSITEDGAARLSYTGPDGKFYAAYADPKLVTLLRHAPVDLATCELPVGVSWARSYETDTSGILHHRGAVRGFVTLDNGDEAAPLLSDLRSLDAPAPAPDQSDMAAEIDRLRGLLEPFSKFADCVSDRNIADDARLGFMHKEEGHFGLKGATMATVGDLRRAREALASTAPACAGKAGAWTYKTKVPDGQTPLDDKLTHRFLGVLTEGGIARVTGAQSPYHGHSLEHCLHAVGWVQRDLRLALDAAKASPVCPPGHIMIGDRAVPEPMREAPEEGVRVWVADPAALAPFWVVFSNTAQQRVLLSRGLIHATEAAARAHAVAIIALSAGEG